MRVFGRTVLSVTCEGAQQFEDPAGITGGPSVYMERDLDPPVPEERHNREFDRFGFHPR